MKIIVYYASALLFFASFKMWTESATVKRVSEVEEEVKSSLRKSHALMSFFPKVCGSEESMNKRGECRKARPVKRKMTGLNKDFLKFILSKHGLQGAFERKKSMNDSEDVHIAEPTEVNTLTPYETLQEETSKGDLVENVTVFYETLREGTINGDSVENVSVETRPDTTGKYMINNTRKFEEISHDSERGVTEETQIEKVYNILTDFKNASTYPNPNLTPTLTSPLSTTNTNASTLDFSKPFTETNIVSTRSTKLPQFLILTTTVKNKNETRISQEKSIITTGKLFNSDEATTMKTTSTIESTTGLISLNVKNNSVKKVPETTPSIEQSVIRESQKANPSRDTSTKPQVPHTDTRTKLSWRIRDRYKIANYIERYPYRYNTLDLSTDLKKPVFLQDFYQLGDSYHEPVPRKGNEFLLRKPRAWKKRNYWAH